MKREGRAAARRTPLLFLPSLPFSPRQPNVRRLSAAAVLASLALGNRMLPPPLTSTPPLRLKKMAPTAFRQSEPLDWQRPTLAQARHALPSALQRFTSVFEMGTGGTTVLISPDDGGLAY